MIRQETITIGAVRGATQLTNVHGFAWNPAAPENVVAEDALVSVEVEYSDGRVGRYALRPRVWYGAARLMTRVWFWSAAGGDAALDVGNEPGDVVQPSAGTEAASLESWGAVQSSPVYPAGWPGWQLSVARPTGARGLALYAQTDSALGIPLGNVDLLSDLGVPVQRIGAAVQLCDSNAPTQSGLVALFGSSVIGAINGQGNVVLLRPEAPPPVLRITNTNDPGWAAGKTIGFRPRWLF